MPPYPPGPPPPEQSVAPRKPIAFVSAAAPPPPPAAPPPPAPPPPAPQVSWDTVPEGLREALQRLEGAEPESVKPALAFFAQDFGGRTGTHQIVLEGDGEGGSIVLKLDFEGQTWKRVRKKAKAA